MNIDEIIKNLEKEGYTNIFIWSDTKGTHYDWHTHPYEEIRIMIKGEMIINTKEKTYLLKAGDKLKVPAGEEHNAEILEDCEYICASKI
ncbi:putative cupin domain protein [Nautilia profundicola AmH]|uniref:Cupin domain protein n=1 Tax=Nautilia profundicola (strain ATCC BAA-1463 / DSM 18972 / AmH) TaxID=598659 RepID=B9LAC1_NAUPA|nr:cupin domain-containing protein [Nautilia profundicola]ACM92668.1 putative cupin domain protein [Nautilia profundicola AmH]